MLQREIEDLETKIIGLEKEEAELEKNIRDLESVRENTSRLASVTTFQATEIREGLKVKVRE